MKVQTSYMYDGVQWVGVVLDGRKVLTVGCMATEEGIRGWLAEVVKTFAWETGTEPPDLYDTFH